MTRVMSFSSSLQLDADQNLPCRAIPDCYADENERWALKESGWANYAWDVSPDEEGALNRGQLPPGAFIPSERIAPLLVKPEADAQVAIPPNPTDLTLEIVGSIASEALFHSVVDPGKSVEGFFTPQMHNVPLETRPTPELSPSRSMSSETDSDWEAELEFFSRAQPLTAVSAKPGPTARLLPPHGPSRTPEARSKRKHAAVPYPKEAPKADPADAKSLAVLVCPVCGYEQKPGPGARRTFDRHRLTHPALKKLKWFCRGIPQPNGQYYGGCHKELSRKDALQRHIKTSRDAICVSDFLPVEVLNISEPMPENMGPLHSLLYH